VELEGVAHFQQFGTAKEDWRCIYRTWSVAQGL